MTQEAQGARRKARKAIVVNILLNSNAMSLIEMIQDLNLTSFSFGVRMIQFKLHIEKYDLVKVSNLIKNT